MTSRISDRHFCHLSFRLRWVKAPALRLIVDGFVAVCFLLTISVLLSSAAEKEPAVNPYQPESGLIRSSF